jgi:hypothetical protein
MRLGALADRPAAVPNPPGALAVEFCPSPHEPPLSAPEAYDQLDRIDAEHADVFLVVSVNV